MLSGPWVTTLLGSVIWVIWPAVTEKLCGGMLGIPGTETVPVALSSLVMNRESVGTAKFCWNINQNSFPLLLLAPVNCSTVIWTVALLTSAPSDAERLR